jgi:hypothetical protein
MSRGSGWRWFLAWVLVGGLLLFSLLAAASIGVFVLPFALLALWLVTRTARMGIEVLGSVAGAGLVCLGVAFAHRDYEPCPEGAVTLAPGERSFSCGGSDPLPWLVAGLALAAAGALAYAVARRLARRLDDPALRCRAAGSRAAPRRAREVG